MPRKLIKRYLPDNNKITENKWLKLLGPVLFNPLLWHLHRRNVAKAVAVGLFCAFLPLPLQMLLAAVAAIVFRANLPIAISLVWISNPFTMAFFLIITYKVGVLILGTPIRTSQFSVSVDWLIHEASIIWKPFLLGTVVCGGVSAFIGYIATNIFWRQWVRRQWQKRKLRSYR
ncbi:MAG: ATP-binding protein [Gammaproteobacteria bacterium RIFCSPHIGHO2_12_FULL_35_23]|nr:MAG: ATP-binding protein [Gammaproteobacteria bacterium RIFCSPHIGHO2_12_FULL_35_23]